MSQCGMPPGIPPNQGMGTPSLALMDGSASSGHSNASHEMLEQKGGMESQMHQAHHQHPHQQNIRSHSDMMQQHHTPPQHQGPSPTSMAPHSMLMGGGSLHNPSMAHLHPGSMQEQYTMAGSNHMRNLHNTMATLPHHSIDDGLAYQPTMTHISHQHPSVSVHGSLVTMHDNLMHPSLTNSMVDMSS